MTTADVVRRRNKNHLILNAFVSYLRERKRNIGELFLPLQMKFSFLLSSLLDLFCLRFCFDHLRTRGHTHTYGICVRVQLLVHLLAHSHKYEKKKKPNNNVRCVFVCVNKLEII